MPQAERLGRQRGHGVMERRDLLDCSQSCEPVLISLQIEQSMERRDSRHRRETQEETVDKSDFLSARIVTVRIPKCRPVGRVEDTGEDEGSKGEDGQVDTEKVEMFLQLLPPSSDRTAPATRRWLGSIQLVRLLASDDGHALPS